MHILTVDYNTPTAPQLFCQSLKETGFAVLKNHPISPELIKQVYHSWSEFFYLPIEEKNKFLYNWSTQDGYFPFRSENAKGRKISDLKEFFHVYPWGQIPSNTRAASLEMYDSLQSFSAELLQWIENDLPEPVAKRLTIPLREMIQNSTQTLLRILHYPPLQNNTEDEAVRAAPHEDINLITLLPAATTPGLEVLDNHGNWHEVNCDPGTIVVNVGDMLQLATEYYFKSTTHRVINPANNLNNHSRFSMPLFLHPRKEVMLTERVTAIDYLHERLRAIGVY